MSQSSYPQNNLGMNLIPMKIRNQTGRENLFIYAVGTTHPTDPKNNKYYLSDFEGNVKKCEPTTGESISYSMPINSNELTIKIPMLAGFRFYFSFGKKLFITVPGSGGNEGIPNEPAGWVKSDENFETLYDNIELTWVEGDNDMTIGANLTQVDLFGFPICLELTGFDPDKKPITLKSGFSTAGVRDNLLKDMRNAPKPWNQLVISNNGADLRAICPYHGMREEGNDFFPSDYLDDYINKVWQKYETETLMASSENITFLGKVSNDKLIFSPESGTGDSITFLKPSTRDLYLQGPLMDKPSGKGGVIQAALQAAFMRSTLLVSPNLPECNAALFYQNEPINEYAKIIHQFGTDGGAYAFGFDDVCSKSSTIVVHQPVSAQVTLLQF